VQPSAGGQRADGKRGQLVRRVLLALFHYVNVWLLLALIHLPMDDETQGCPPGIRGETRRKISLALSGSTAAA
jgi:hypothetical protein